MILEVFFPTPADRIGCLSIIAQASVLKVVFSGDCEKSLKKAPNQRGIGHTTFLFPSANTHDDEHSAEDHNGDGEPQHER
ncbi:hypothetical protein ALO78_200376 [Pseudomonas amygdali pv. ciccaronei]|nr:hypothetical protein ALO78_200376 [Pseudomonas amygdali pv. ciccaronei]